MVPHTTHTASVFFAVDVSTYKSYCNDRMLYDSIHAVLLLDISEKRDIDRI